MGMLWQDNFEMMQASCLFLLWSTSPHWGFLPAIIINLVITKWWFATCIISSASISWNSTVRKSSCLFHLFTYLVIYLYQYDLVRIDFILWIISIITYLIFKVSQIWLQEPLQVGPCVLLTCPHFFFFFCTSSLYGSTKVLQAHLVLSLSNLRISHFSKELWFLLLKKPRPSDTGVSLLIGHLRE